LNQRGLFRARPQGRPKLAGLVVVLAWGAVGLAVVLQHAFDMQPCAWCTLQRLIFLVVGALALIVWWRQNAGERALPWVALGVGFSIAGLCAALYQQFVAAQSQSCALSLADRIIKGASLDQVAPWLFKATAFCHEANLPLLGISFAIWSAALFVVLETLLVLSALKRPAY
jgi:protein dithiol:quinone oxidoreductase